MESLKKSLALLASTLLFCLVSSCEDDHQPIYESFPIRVDSIQLPENITTNAPFEIVFFGTIGTNGCYQFSQFETEKHDDTIIVEAWGKVDSKSENCPTVMVYLDGEKLTYQINEAGNYTIKIKQPDDTFLEKQITVEPD